LDGLAVKTVRSHVDLLRPVTMLIGNIPLRDLTAHDVRHALNTLAEQRSTRTMASTHNVLVRAIRHAEANDHVGRNVATFVKPPQGKTGRPSRAMTAVEAAALLAAAKDDPRLGGYVILSLTTGIRTEEAGALWHDEDLVFTSSTGTPLDASHVRRDFRVLCKRAGIEGVWAPRELRHTFVSVMSESGVAVEEIARLAGHASSRTTETIYRHELRRSSPPAPT
jgi:integrase